MTILHPATLLLIPLIPLALWWRRRRGEPAVRFAAAPLLADAPASWRTRLFHLPAILASAGCALLVVALARPVVRVTLPAVTEGIDVVLCIDVSSSMAARDLDEGRSRLDVAKASAARFVAGRGGDRIALVTFARYPDLACPFTRDHAALAEILAGVALVAPDGPEDATGIGTATALAARLLQGGAAKSKVVILLTDGEETVATAQTPREIAPLHAAQLCKKLGLRVYAIAVGEPGADGRLSVDVGQVRRMTEDCDGAFFRARDQAALDAVYAHIDALERTPAESARHRFDERFLPFLVAALAALAAAATLRAALGGLP